MFSAQVIKTGEPLPDMSEDRIVWSNSVNIHRIAKNGAVDYTVEFSHPPRVNDPIDELVRRYVNEAVAKLPR